MRVLAQAAPPAGTRRSRRSVARHASTGARSASRPCRSSRCRSSALLRRFALDRAGATRARRRRVPARQRRPDRAARRARVDGGLLRGRSRRRAHARSRSCRGSTTRRSRASAGRTRSSVAVVEQSPFARWGDDRPAQRARRAVPAQRALSCRRSLPLLEGPDGSEARGRELYLDAQGRLLEAGLRLTGVRLDDARRLGADARRAASIVRLGRQSVQSGWSASSRSRARRVAKRVARNQLRRPALHQRFRVGWSGPIARTGRARLARRTLTPDGSEKAERNLIVGLDIGTSKVVAIVGEYAPGGTIEVIGIGSHPSRGLKRGVVVDIESTVQSIQRAIEEAELMAGCQIRSVYAGIAGSHMRSLNSHGIVADPRQGSRRRRSRPRARRGEGGRDSGRPEDPAHPAAGIHHRRAGRHPPSGRHVRRAPRSERAPRDRRRQRRAEHHQVRAALRPAGRRHRARAARLERTRC